MGLFHKLHQSVEIINRFTGEADYQRGTQCNRRNFTAQLGDQVTDLLFAAPPLHGLENRVADMLNRYIQILANLGFIADQLYQAVRNAVGGGIQQTDPAQPVNSGQAANQGFQGRTILHVAAVAGNILGDHVDFLDPTGDQYFSLSHQRVQRSGAIGTAQLRDDAVGTAVGAPLTDLQVGVPGGRRVEARQGFIVNVIRIPDVLQLTLYAAFFSQNFGNAGVVTGADEDIHLGQFMGQFFLITLRQAPRNDQGVAAAIALALGQVQDGIDTFLLGLFDKGTGIDDDNIGIFFVSGDLVLLLGEHPQHDLGINQVLRAAKADHADFLFYSLAQNILTRNYSLKFKNCISTSRSLPLRSWIASWRSSRFLPVTRTWSSWIWPC